LLPSRSRDVIVTGGVDYDDDDAGTVRIWDTNGQPIGETLTGHTGPVNAVAIGRLRDHDVIVTGGRDATVRTLECGISQPNHIAHNRGRSLHRDRQWRGVRGGRLSSRGLAVVLAKHLKRI
jgi:WD40 repeat protein